MLFNELTEIMRDRKLEFETFLPEDSNTAAEIEALVSDSREAGEKSIFACVKGEHSDGHSFAEKAAAQGASALLCERKLDLPLPQIICSNVRSSMGAVASCLYGFPAEKLTMVGITGTNGKTTSTFMLRSILETAGIKTGLLGTVFYSDGNENTDADHTTPEGSDLQMWLAKMVKNGCKACVMEVSSHSLDQGRVAGVEYNSGGFTNLTVDHLDYHKNMENYFSAKKKLLGRMKKEWSFSVNIDDAYGKRIKDEYGDKVITYSMKDESADFYAEICDSSISGTKINIKFPGKISKETILLPVIGDYNIMNALQASSIAWSLGIELSSIQEGLLKMSQVPGRLEKYHIKGSGTYIIDFAHTPDALEKTIELLRNFCEHRLFVLFGAGGDRDNSKRSIMGEIATRLADYTVITSDNPRSEDPDSIIAEIETGAKKNSGAYELVTDRTEAICHALDMLEEGDILLVAGKGAEQKQIFKDRTVPYRDIDVLKSWSKKRDKEVLI